MKKCLTTGRTDAIIKSQTRESKKPKAKSQKPKEKNDWQKEKGVSPLDTAEHIAEQLHIGFVSLESCERNPKKED